MGWCDLQDLIVKMTLEPALIGINCKVQGGNKGNGSQRLMEQAKRTQLTHRYDWKPYKLSFGDRFMDKAVNKRLRKNKVEVV